MFCPCFVIKLFLCPFKFYNHLTEQERTGGLILISELRHELSINVVCATSKASYQPAHMRSLIRAIASRLNIYEC